MSTSEGAFDATLPVAAHMPGGGFVSMSFKLALRNLLEAVETLVEVRARCLPVVFPFGIVVELSWRPSGCGKDTGVETFA